MFDEKMTSAERENMLRADYLRVQGSINELVSVLAKQYRELTDLKELITDYEVYGEKYLYSEPLVSKMKASHNACGYDF